MEHGAHPSSSILHDQSDRPSIPDRKTNIIARGCLCQEVVDEESRIHSELSSRDAGQGGDQGEDCGGGGFHCVGMVGWMDTGELLIVGLVMTLLGGKESKGGWNKWMDFLTASLKE